MAIGDPVIQQNATTSGESGENLDNGPLKSLERNLYAPIKLTYPSDLNSPKKLHSVKFQATEVVAATWGDVQKSFTDKTNAVTDAFKEEQAKLAAVTDNKTITEIPGAIAGTLFQDGLNAITSGTANEQVKKIIGSTKTPYSKSGDTITLYMPDNAEFSQGANYNQIGILEAASSIPFLGKVPSMALSAFQNSAAKVALNSFGYVFNPQEQVLFEGIEFRTFSMSFTLTPYSSSEAKEIRDIIKSFRKNAAPTIQTGGAGFFFTPPSVFNITFLYDGKENKNINKIKPCVLTDVTVNYAPNGTWSTYEDGSPVQTALTLSFKEIELVDRNSIETGGY